MTRYVLDVFILEYKVRIVYVVQNSVYSVTDYTTKKSQLIRSDRVSHRGSSFQNGSLY